MQKQMHTTTSYPPPPARTCARSISECRIQASLSKFDGKSSIHIYTHCTDTGRTDYFIELLNNVPCVVTYVNGRRADVREILP
jgi:hypothetical protein